MREAAVYHESKGMGIGIGVREPQVAPWGREALP